MTRSQRQQKTTRLALWGVMTAIALVLTVAESMLIPVSFFPIPGFRLGLSNIAVLVCLYVLGPLPSMGIVLIRTLAVFAFSGNPVAFLFSICGGMASVCAMIALNRLKIFSFFGVSAGGAAAHALAQIAAAILLVGSASLFAYLPVLLWASVAAGLIVALISVPIYRAIDSSIHFGRHE